jgi:hypothetical protein
MNNIPEKHRGIPWNSEDIDTLVKMYTDGNSVSDIVTNICRTKDAVQHKIKDLGLTDRNKRWTEYEIEKIVSLKEEGISYKKIADILNRTERGVQGKLLRVKNKKPLKIRINKKSKNNRRVYEVNDNYFSNINSQKKSYYLGFLMTDGYVLDKINSRKGIINSNTVGLKLAIKDIEVLEGFKKDLNSNYPIPIHKVKKSFINGKEINSTDSCTFEFNSEQIKNDISIYGVIPRKTYICKFPERLDKKYYPGFISGLISGDGCVSLRTNHNALTPVLKTNLAGTFDLLESVKKVFVDEIGFNVEKKAWKYKNAKHLYSIELNHSETLRMYRWMKENGTCLMFRKQKIIEDFISNYPEKCRIA